MAEEETGAGTGTETVPDDTETGTGSGSGKTPEQQLAEMRAALKKANKEAADHRGRAAKLEEQFATDAEKATKAKVEEATKAEQEKWRPRVIKAEARNALREAGASTAAVSRLIALIDTSTAEVDDDGNVTGLDTQVTQIKKEWPELFAEKKAGKNAGPSSKAVGAGNTGDGGGDQRPKRSADTIAATLGFGSGTS
jgi:phage shock protein A